MVFSDTNKKKKERGVKEIINRRRLLEGIILNTLHHIKILADKSRSVGFICTRVSIKVFGQRTKCLILLHRGIT